MQNIRCLCCFWGVKKWMEISNIGAFDWLFCKSTDFFHSRFEIVSGYSGFVFYFSAVVVNRIGRVMQQFGYFSAIVYSQPDQSKNA